MELSPYFFHLLKGKNMIFSSSRIALGLWIAGCVLCSAEQVLVEISDVPSDGFVVCPLDVTSAANWLGVERLDGAEFFHGDKKVDAVFVPGDSPLRGTFVAVLPNDVPRGGGVRLRVANTDNVTFPPPSASVVAIPPLVVFIAEKQGGLPSSISFANGKNSQAMRWHDRLYDPVTQGWNITNDNDASVALVVSKPFVSVVQTTAAFKKGNDAPPSKPKAQYQWFVFPKRDLVYVSIFAQQDTPTAWKEKHFLELHIPDGSFGKWFADGQSGTFTGSQKSTPSNRYAGFVDDANNVIATLGKATVYDGLGGFGPYLLPKGSDAWQAWTDTKFRTTTWLWIGNTPEPAKTLQAAYESVSKMPRAEIVIPELTLDAKDWKAAALNDLFLSGKIESKAELERLRNADKLPEQWINVELGDLGMILEMTNDKEKGQGLRLLSLVDVQTKTVLSARESVPLFTAELLDKTTGKTVSISSDNGWQNITEGMNSRYGLYFDFTGCFLPDADNLFVRLIPFSYNPQPFGWDLGISYDGIERYDFRKASVGQIALRNLGPTMKTFYPHVSGVVTKNPVGKELRWQGTYPSGWCSMPFTAVYDESKNVGLYVAAHDSGGAVKDIRLDADVVADSLTIRFEHPLPLGKKTVDVHCYWRVFHGDWYDAAMIYRDIVRTWAEWYPRDKLGPDGRTDTPQWMKELCVWAQCGNSPQTMPAAMRKFTDALGVPTAVHWYNWHQIPFDNDYPHYFPVKDGFKAAVAEIQKNGDCYVMPYINGRLWDTRDKGAEDFQFTAVALPGATKKEDGKPYIETYGSKEADGSNVELAVMCPATDVWKNKVTENIFRLMNDYGVASVYVDQVAAAKPELCFDASHGHPLAGGDWWNREHWKLYAKIRAEMPKEKMLTTECNAEPFINCFDGYLTWHFQYQDQVPAFAAVYGGAVQMFGRAYRGGPSQVLADRMKAAEQLVYGEQIGWLDPRIVDDPKRFPFFKAIVLTRHKHRDYFYKGEMIRPPKLLDAIPTVTADWQWSGETLITTDAVQTGAWRKTDGKGKTISAVFFFVNVSDNPITSRVAARLDEIGLKSNVFENPLTFDPGVPLAIEVR